ncbi:MAG: hypothetical protein KDI62_25865, partial [Anaerolineae bacterium]|nr:hypothetical protein [Anaerolineae bacterium]
MLRKTFILLLGTILLSLIAACGASPEPVTVVETVVVTEEVEKIVTVEVAVEATTEAESGPLVVFGAYATAIEEPWDGVIHAALNAAQESGQIEYTFSDDIGYSGDMERILREVAEETQPDVISGDAFVHEEAVRRVAPHYTDIAFAFIS